MKIQKRFIRKHKNKDYYKYVVNIPPMILKEAGFDYDKTSKDTKDLEIEVKAEKGKIVIKKKV
jgi:hypothetical protein